MFLIALFTKYWKELVIVLAFVACGLFVSNVISTKKELEVAKTTIITLNVEKRELAGKIGQLAIISDTQAKKLDEAEAERRVIMDDLSKKINTIRIQTVPKDCPGAMDYAIKNKGDLSWPK